MENKKIGFFRGKSIAAAVFAIVLLFFAGMANASVAPKIQLMNYSISENPAEPGHVVTLALHLKSMEWDNCADTVSVQLSTPYPLSIQGPDTQYMDHLCYNDSYEAGTVVFKLPVDSLAQTGTYQVTSVVTYEKRFSKYTETNTINVRVGGSPSFTASVISSNPVDIYPGDTASVTVVFQNTGSALVESSHVDFLSGSKPLEIKWAGASQETGQIPARSSIPVTFSLEVDKNATPGYYPFTASISYSDELKSTGSQDFSFTVPVKKKADFDTSASNGTSVLVANSDTDVTIELKNTGFDVARKVKVRLRPLFPFSTDGTVRYIDAIRPGETADLVYTIHTDKDATAGSQISGVLIDFEDAQGRQFSDSSDFSLTVRQRTLEEKAWDYWYVGAIIGVFLLITIVRTIRGFFKKKK